MGHWMSSGHPLSADRSGAENWMSSGHPFSIDRSGM